MELFQIQQLNVPEIELSESRTEVYGLTMLTVALLPAYLS